MVWFKPYIDYFFNNQIYLFSQTQKHSYKVRKIIYDKDHTLIQYIYIFLDISLNVNVGHYNIFGFL